MPGLFFERFRGGVESLLLQRNDDLVHEVQGHEHVDRAEEEEEGHDVVLPLLGQEDEEGEGEETDEEEADERNEQPPCPLDYAFRHGRLIEKGLPQGDGHDHDRKAAHKGEYIEVKPALMHGCVPKNGIIISYSVAGVKASFGHPACRHLDRLLRHARTSFGAKAFPSKISSAIPSLCASISDSYSNVE